MTNWFQHFSNPYITPIKKLLFEILKEKYGKHEEIIEKIAKSISNDKEYELTGKFFIELYETAYHKAVEEHKKHLDKLGIKAKIVSAHYEENKEDIKIFQSEK